MSEPANHPVVNEQGMPVEVESELAKDPARMRALKAVLGKTETELYLLEGGVSEELIKANESAIDKTLLELEDVIAEIEAIKKESPDQDKRRWDAWALRIQGYSAPEIAKNWGVSVQLIYAYWDWCGKMLPEVKQHMEEFTSVSVQRLEAQYRQLAIARSRGDILAHKVSLDIIDQQAKLLGVHKMNVQVDTTVTYKLEGVNMDEL